MKHLGRPPFLAILIAACFFGVNAISASAHPSLDITASNWKFTPAVVDAHVGEATTLRFNSSEGVHGVESAELGIAKTIIVPGKIAEVTFTPKKAGTFKVPCAVVCGPGHDTMLLTVKVSSGSVAAKTGTDIVASNWKFTPAAIDAKVGEASTLRFSSTEGVHGVESSDLGIKKTIITPGKTAEVTFTPKKAGTYKVQCAVVCGPGHDAMLLSVKVSE